MAFLNKSFNGTQCVDKVPDTVAYQRNNIVKDNKSL